MKFTSFKQNPLKAKFGLTKSDLYILIYLLTITILIRLPFFFIDTINWDESTYILMGQYILDGHLPYVDFWDLKPPIAFLCYAFFIAGFKSIISVRIAGALCIFLTSFFTYLVGKRICNNNISFLSAILFIFLSSLLESGQATMAEHVALVPLVGALSLLATQKSTPLILFFSGILMAIASMIRLNLAYVALIILFFILLESLLRSGSYKHIFAYLFGNFLVIAFSYLPYAIDYPKIWWSSVILAPLRYSELQRSALEAFREQVLNLFANHSSLSPLLYLVWTGGFAGTALFIAQWKSYSRTKKRSFILIFLFLVGTVISILKGGATHAHYLIQLAPFISLLSAIAFHKLLTCSVRRLTISTIILSLAISLKPIISQYVKVVSNIFVNKEITYGAAYEIAEFLKQENLSGEPVYMMTDHIVYWFISQKPLSKVVHPSNISREYILRMIDGAGPTSEIEMNNILTQNPEFIVKRENTMYLRRMKKARLLFEEVLRTKYELIKTIQGRQIYRRI